MNIIKCVIPARGGSKSIPYKNIAMLCGMPLIYYSIVTARKVFGEVYVSTEDSKIANISASLGALILNRPAELATDSATDYGWVKHAFCALDCDVMCILRPTTPFRDASIVQKAKEDFMAHLVLGNDPVSSLRSAHEVNEHPFKCVTELDGYWKPFSGTFADLDSPRQNFQQTYSPNGYVDFTIKKTIDSGSIYGQNILKFVTPKTIDIDSKDDLLLANLYCDRFIR